MRRRITDWYSLAVYPALLLLNLVTAQRVLSVGPLRFTVFDAVAVPLVLVGLVLLGRLPGRRALWAASWPFVAAFGGLLAWAAATGVGKTWVVRLSELGTNDIPLPAWVAYVPLGQAACALVFAWLLNAAVPADRVKGWLFGLCALMLGCGLIGEARALTDERIDSRLDTGLGGAAVLPVVLILVCATALGLASSGYRPAWSRVLAAVAAVELLLTGSRAGSIMLVTLLVLTVVRWWITGRRSVQAYLRVGAALVAGLVFAAVLLWSAPELQRIFHTTDPSREQNLVTALGIVTHDWGRMIFGMGTGVIWPWYASDAHVLPGQVPIAWTWVSVPYSDGFLLASPHSLFLGVFVELGLVGLGILALLLGLVVRAAWRARRQPLAGMILLGAVTTFAAFPFDHYLLRNFGVSWMWWLFVLSALLLARDQPASR